MENGTPFDGDYRAALKGDYLAAVEFGERRPTMTIRRVHKVQMDVRKIGADDADGAKKQDKLVVYFAEVEGRGWVLNRTNAQCVAAMFGTQTRGWIGKRVTLVAEMVQIGPKKDLGIRVAGSPDLDREITAKIELPRRKPTTRRLIPTRAGAASTQEPAQPAEESPPEPEWRDPDEREERL